MTEHVYIVARAGRLTGVSLTVHGDALSALAEARYIAQDNGWEADTDHAPGAEDCVRCGKQANPGQLYMAHGDGEEDWIEVQQRSVDPRPRVQINALGMDDSGLARVVTRAMVKQARR